MIYKVTKQFATGAEQPCRTFKELEEAKVYANDNASANAALKIKVIYRVFEFDDIQYEIDSSKIELPQIASENNTTQGGKQTGSTFKPTPFEMAPRPKGTPQKWIIDPEEDKK